MRTGQLHMSIDRDTYEQLGLTGQETKFKPYNERYSMIPYHCYVYMWLC